MANFGSEAERTIVLRFAENFSPDCGTILAHQTIIDESGAVWYGKLGAPVSKAVQQRILANPLPRILLIHSGGTARWWAYINAIQRDTPPLEEIPAYYRKMAEDIGCWFHVVRFEPAPKDIMSKCVVASSKRPLSSASRHSMSPYFIIDAPTE